MDTVKFVLGFILSILITGADLNSELKNNMNMNPEDLDTHKPKISLINPKKQNHKETENIFSESKEYETLKKSKNHVIFPVVKRLEDIKIFKPQHKRVTRHTNNNIHEELSDNSDPHIEIVLDLLPTQDEKNSYYEDSQYYDDYKEKNFNGLVEDKNLNIEIETNSKPVTRSRSESQERKRCVKKCDDNIDTKLKLQSRLIPQESTIKTVENKEKKIMECDNCKILQNIEQPYNSENNIELKNDKDKKIDNVLYNIIEELRNSKQLVTSKNQRKLLKLKNPSSQDQITKNDPNSSSEEAMTLKFEKAKKKNVIDVLDSDPENTYINRKLAGKYISEKNVNVSKKSNIQQNNNEEFNNLLKKQKSPGFSRESNILPVQEIYNNENLSSPSFDDQYHENDQNSIENNRFLQNRYYKNILSSTSIKNVTEIESDTYISPKQQLINATKNKSKIINNNGIISNQSSRISKNNYNDEYPLFVSNRRTPILPDELFAYDYKNPSSEVDDFPANSHSNDENGQSEQYFVRNVNDQVSNYKKNLENGKNVYVNVIKRKSPDLLDNYNNNKYDEYIKPTTWDKMSVNKKNNEYEPVKLLKEFMSLVNDNGSNEKYLKKKEFNKLLKNKNKISSYNKSKKNDTPSDLTTNYLFLSERNKMLGDSNMLDYNNNEEDQTNAAPIETRINKEKSFIPFKANPLLKIKSKERIVTNSNTNLKKPSIVDLFVPKQEKNFSHTKTTQSSKQPQLLSETSETVNNSQNLKNIISQFKRQLKKNKNGSTSNENPSVLQHVETVKISNNKSNKSPQEFSEDSSILKNNKILSPDSETQVSLASNTDVEDTNSESNITMTTEKYLIQKKKKDMQSKKSWRNIWSTTPSSVLQKKLQESNVNLTSHFPQKSKISDIKPILQNILNFKKTIKKVDENYNTLTTETPISFNKFTNKVSSPLIPTPQNDFKIPKKTNFILKSLLPNKHDSNIDKSTEEEIGVNNGSILRKISNKNLKSINTPNIKKSKISTSTTTSSPLSHEESRSNDKLKVKILARPQPNVLKKLKSDAYPNYSSDKENITVKKNILTIKEPFIKNRNNEKNKTITNILQRKNTPQLLNTLKDNSKKIEKSSKNMNLPSKSDEYNKDININKKIITKNLNINYLANYPQDVRKSLGNPIKENSNKQSNPLTKSIDKKNSMDKISTLTKKTERDDLLFLNNGQKNTKNKNKLILLPKTVEDNDSTEKLFSNMALSNLHNDNQQTFQRSNDDDSINESELKHNIDNEGNFEESSEIIDAKMSNNDDITEQMANENDQIVFSESINDGSEDISLSEPLDKDDINEKSTPRKLDDINSQFLKTHPSTYFEKNMLKKGLKPKLEVPYLNEPNVEDDQTLYDEDYLKPIRIDKLSEKFTKNIEEQPFIQPLTRQSFLENQRNIGSSETISDSNYDNSEYNWLNFNEVLKQNNIESNGLLNNPTPIPYIRSKGNDKVPNDKNACERRFEILPKVKVFDGEFKIPLISQKDCDENNSEYISDVFVPVEKSNGQYSALSLSKLLKGDFRLINESSDDSINKNPVQKNFNNLNMNELLSSTNYIVNKQALNSIQPILTRVLHDDNKERDSEIPIRIIQIINNGFYLGKTNSTKENLSNEENNNEDIIYPVNSGINIDSPEIKTYIQNFQKDPNLEISKNQADQKIADISMKETPQNIVKFRGSDENAEDRAKENILTDKRLEELNVTPDYCSMCRESKEHAKHMHMESDNLEIGNKGNENSFRKIESENRQNLYNDLPRNQEVEEDFRAKDNFNNYQDPYDNPEVSERVKMLTDMIVAIKNITSDPITNFKDIP
ncbi:putative uncharacterized protein DDB_G0282133 [Daktulosphaira vitifoliae]|uniref:putative uncharacterized protein DDB_G0282133 n=1 Tax=Daktulosphaira vitifoliae TaxID=58002 RepID=UPI0021A9B99E|nr:putative uncharacterized protein DDB_G0282133 [Daktulosphaira vitifoliae]XP_050532026.1 putative uncharacterized protein DDB_G0282133 [Daktulosphaira vitifoliae]